MENLHMCELSQKGPQVRGGENFNFFFLFFFSKVFEIEENRHILTPGQLKYKKFPHLDGKCAHVWTDPKMSPSPRGRKLHFFLFFEKFSKMKKIIIFSLQDS